MDSDFASKLSLTGEEQPSEANSKQKQQFALDAETPVKQNLNCSD